MSKLLEKINQRLLNIRGWFNWRYEQEVSRSKIFTTNDIRQLEKKTWFLLSEVSFSEIIYCYKNNLHKKNLNCLTCHQNKKVFLWFREGYSIWCSNSCVQRNSITTQKRRENNLKKYGVESTSSLSSVLEKSRKTTLLKYGVEHYSHLEDKKKKERKIRKKTYYWNTELIMFEKFLKQ